jgi:hypothetical protein
LRKNNYQISIHKYQIISNHQITMTKRFGA